MMTADSIKTLVDQIRNVWPPNRWVEYNVLVAVSGGADSVALLKALAEIKKANETDASGLLIVAHFNHQLRGADSDGDADFVRQLAASLELEFRSGSAEHDSAASSENDLREQRYKFLVEAARKSNCRYIATAHHRDDQVETVLFRLFRGTGVGGLGGIPTARVVDESLTIIRPMLNVSKCEIESALGEWNQTWRIDVSNTASQYTRNFIRNEILPNVRERFGSIDESVVRLSQQASEQQEFVLDQALALFDAVSQDGENLLIDCGKLQGQSPVLLRELFIEVFRRQSWPVSQLGFRELNRLACLVGSENDEPRFQLPGAISCQKDDGVVRLVCD